MLRLYLSRLFLPLEGEVLFADVSAENRAWLTAHLGPCPMRAVSRQELRQAVTARHGAALLDDAVFGLAHRFPQLSARTVITKAQLISLCALAALLLAALVANPLVTIRTVAVLLSLAFSISGAFRVLLALLAKPRRAPSPAEHTTLPSYTILVPLYREAAVLPGLVRGLGALDYPRHLLDIKLVVEEDDLETVAAARAMLDGDVPFEIVEVPPGGPRTKPKAANYALAFARGEYLVVYDAEDRPERDQLKKAIATFRASSRRTACLQARLNFYNADHNWLTRMFALDYALWFDTLLPGLDRIGVPMPLGGTSNHFRTAVLRDIGGWDAFNVTEDADIGIRLAQMGYRVSMLDSTTFEEAPVKIGAWLKQRSRWLKGYMQTWLVHMRDPVALMRRTGLRGFLAFQLFIGGGVVFALASPPLWFAFVAALLLHWSSGVGGPGALIPGAGLLANNVLLTYLAVLAPRRRGWDELAPYGLTVIAYWGLASAAGYRGLWQLVTRPFFWEKTQHGVMTPE
ncbi:MAG: glycosyltransferase [Alphaproteobacteria bacterium]|nr:glycosyltransferase [Alphaproteobacteria bacterium]